MPSAAKGPEGDTLEEAAQSPTAPASQPPIEVSAMGQEPSGPTGDSLVDVALAAGATTADSQATQPVRLRFRAQVGSQPFDCGASYAPPGAPAVDFTPVDLRLFVQEPRLIDAFGKEHAIVLDVQAPWQLEDVALLDFEDGSGSCVVGTTDTNMEITGFVPPGEYTGLSFSNAVPERFNHADPATLPPPLQAGGMSWGWLLGYRFVMAEVVATPAGDQERASALLHLGSTGCSGNPSLGTIRCERPNRNRIVLEEFNVERDAVVVDIRELLAEVDLGTETTCHSSGEECAPFFASVGLATGDGSATAEQTLYRVEPFAPEPL